MIIAMLKAEKEERETRKKTNDVISGYGNGKFIKADGKIKGQQTFTKQSCRIDVQKPVRGKHKLEKYQSMYEDVNAFIAAQAWREPDEQTVASGSTWIEMFTLFDMDGYRRTSSRHRKNEQAAKRTEERTAKDKHEQGKKDQRRRRRKENAESRPSMGEELNHFKRIFKHVVRQDIGMDKAEIFKADYKQHFKRLRNLGIIGHQAAISGNLEMDPITTEEVEKAIYQQKAGCTAKDLKAYKEHQAKEHIAATRFSLKEQKPTQGAAQSGKDKSSRQTRTQPIRTTWI